MHVAGQWSPGHWRALINKLLNCKTIKSKCENSVQRSRNKFPTTCKQTGRMHLAHVLETVLQ